MKNEQKSGERRQFLNLIRQTKPSKLMLSIALLMSVTTTIVGLAIPLFTSKLVDSFSIASITPSQILGAFIGQAIALGMSTQFLIIVCENSVKAIERICSVPANVISIGSYSSFVRRDSWSAAKDLFW